MSCFGIMQPKQFPLSQCIALFFSEWTIWSAKRHLATTFFFFFYAWAGVPRLLSASLASFSLGCTGVVQVSALGCDQASRCERPESHWTRQKCSGPAASTLPPRPSVDEPFLLQLPELSLSSPPTGRCSICQRCQHNDGEISSKLAAFFPSLLLTSLFQSPCLLRKGWENWPSHLTPRLTGERRDFLHQDGVG